MTTRIARAPVSTENPAQTQPTSDDAKAERARRLLVVRDALGAMPVLDRWKPGLVDVFLERARLFDHDAISILRGLAADVMRACPIGTDGYVAAKRARDAVGSLWAAL